MRTSLIRALFLILVATPVFATPTIHVFRAWDSVTIQSGGYVQFHHVNIGGTDSRRFRIENTGNATLRLLSGSLVSAPCFTQLGEAITTIPPGTNTLIRIDFGGCSPGFYSATVRILSNDPATPAFTFAIGGDVLPPPSPNIAVFRPNGNTAANGSTFEFATMPTGGQDIRRFRIDNAGTLPLNLTNPSSIVSGACFSQTETPMTPIAPGASTYVSVRFSCGTGGAHAGTMTISSNDPDTNPWVVNLSGTLTVPQVPDIAVFQPGGESMARNGTYAFGNVTVNAGDTRRFRIDNTGNGTMDIGNPANLVWGECFTQTETPVRLVPPGGSSYFSIRFQCATAGSRTADVVIPSDDPDESPYRFTVTATATATVVQTPDIAVFNPVNAAVAIGGSYAFGSVAVGAADTRRFRIDNTGNAALNIGNASTLISGTCFAQTETPSTPAPAGGSSWFSVRFLCGSSGGYGGAVTITSNDPDESPFTFNLTATATGTVLQNDAAFVSQSVPSSMTTRGTYPASVTMRNNGTTAWGSNFKLGSVTPGNPFGATVSLPSSLTVQPGAAYTFSFNVTAPATAGQYVFQWRMLDAAAPFGATTPAVTVTVQAIPAPVIQVIEPENIPAGTSSYVTLYGNNLGGATVRFPRRGNGSVTPTLQLISSSPNKLTVLVNATNPAVDGFQGMFIETGGGRASAAVRVVPNRPVIDSYTPSEASFGDVFYVGVSGANLDGAVVTTTSAGVEFIGIESSDALLTGVLYAPGGSSSLDTEIIITRPGGGSAHLPLALRERKAITKSMRRVGGDGDDDRREGIYIQSPVVLNTGDFVPGKGAVSAGPWVGNQTEIEFNCDFSMSRSRGHAGVIVILQNPQTHRPDRNILSGLAIGEPRRFESLIAVHTFSFTASVNVHCRFDDPGLVDVDFCIAIHAAFEIVGVGGQSLDLEACTGTNSFVQLRGSGFVNFAYRWGDESTNSSCSTIRDVSADPVLGYRQGEVTLNQCCSDPVSIDAVFTVSEEHGGGEREVHTQVGRTAPKPDCRNPNCPFNVEIRAFIMADHVLGGNLCTFFPPPPLTPMVFPVIYKGDKRGFEPSPGYERARMEQTFCAQTGFGPPQSHCGLSKNFAFDSVVNGEISDDALNDTHEDDCHWLDWSGRQTAPEMTLVPILNAPNGVYRWRSKAHGVHPSLNDILFAAIDWDFTIEIDANHHPAKVYITGAHDGFPAYEIWVNNYQIYGWDTVNSNLLSLADPLDVDVDCERQLGQAPCIEHDPPH